MTIRPVPPILAPFLKREEGVRTRPYRDSIGRWTWGVGHCDATLSDPEVERTDAQVEAALDLDMATAASRLASRSPITQDPAKVDDNRYAALVSFVFNLGVGNWSIWPALEAEEFASIPEHMGQFVYAGRPLARQAGLVARRAAEVALWNGTDPLCKLYPSQPAK